MQYKNKGVQDQLATEADKKQPKKALSAGGKKSASKTTADTSVLNDKCLTLNELKQTLELLEIPLGSSITPPLNYDEVVSELKRYNKEQRAFEMVDWATSRGWALRYLNQVNKDKDKKKTYEQQDLVWADSERKIKWRVLESAIDGDFFSVSKVRERQRFNQRRIISSK